MAVTVASTLYLASSLAHSAEPNLPELAERQSWPALLEAAKTHSNLDERQADGMTALHWAIYHDRTDVALKLLDLAADANAKNAYGVPPLSTACENGNAQIVRRLLRGGADPNLVLLGGETPLHTAARNGRLAVVKALVEAEADVNATETAQQTAVMWAAAEGHADVVSYLIDAGADHKKALRSGFTAFFFAARNGHRDVVVALLDHGIDVNSKMNVQRSGGKKPRRNMSALLLAVESGHFELAVELLESGANPNDQSSGYTALHALTWTRKPNRGDGPDGDPAPLGSGTVNSLQLIRALVRHGADVNLRLKSGPAGRGRLNHKGATAFLLAAKTADVPMLTALLKHGADPLLPNADGSTPLMAASGLGTIAPSEEAGTEDECLAAVELILRNGGDVNNVDDNGETAMHGAAYKSLPRIAHRLAERGARVTVWNRKNKYGWTPLLIAEGHRPGNFKPSFETITAIHDLLKQAGIKPPPPTPRKRRPGYEEPD